MISIIVATTEGGVIGKAGGLPWYLPAELAYFKEATMGHPIVMGRKTHESIGRALPGRTNIVVTHDRQYKAEGCKVAHSFEEARKLAEESPGGEECFVIGGESIYGLALPQAERLYLTKVSANIEGDKYFKYRTGDWRLEWSESHRADERNKYAYEFQRLSRIN